MHRGISIAIGATAGRHGQALGAHGGAAITSIALVTGTTHRKREPSMPCSSAIRVVAVVFIVRCGGSRGCCTTRMPSHHCSGTAEIGNL